LAAATASLCVPLLLALAEAVLDPHYDALRGAPLRLDALRVLVALGATLPAAACFGATYPALASAALVGSIRLGSAGTLLYGVTTRGAALGLGLASFVLPERIGVAASHAAGAAALACAGAAALVASRGAPRVAPAPAAAAAPLPPSLLALAALSGFASLAAQVLLLQAFARVLHPSVFPS